MLEQFCAGATPYSRVSGSTVLSEVRRLKGNDGERMEKVNWELAGAGGLAALAASMVAEPVGSNSLRGSGLAQHLSKAASDAGGEVFQELPGMSLDEHAWKVTHHSVQHIQAKEKVGCDT